MPSSHGKQKHLEKQKKKRELRRQNVKAVTREHSTMDALLRQAAHWPNGPSLISVGWDVVGAEIPPLAMVVVTRDAPGSLVIPAAALVDRTCLGIKDAFLGPPLSDAEIDSWVRDLLYGYGGLVQCDLLVAQSVVYHAIDYARSLGFEPHPAFVEPLFGPRPAELLDTPYARPARPFYAAGPDDDVDAVLAQLDRAVGEGNYDFIMPEESFPDLLAEGWE